MKNTKSKQKYGSLYFGNYQNTNFIQTNSERGPSYDLKKNTWLHGEGLKMKMNQHSIRQAYR